MSTSSTNNDLSTERTINSPDNLNNLNSAAKTLKKHNIREYNRTYAANHRHLVCSTIRGTKRDVQLINHYKKAKGLTWLQIVYRGLGIKRPTTTKA